MAHILIVDDEEYQRLLIRDTLASEPVYEFAEAENGTQALEILQEQPVDLVLLDVMMPKLDGFEVCRILKADPKLRPTQVILVTALGQVEHKVRGLDSGADDFLNKPFEEAELQARVRSALRLWTGIALKFSVFPFSALRFLTPLTDSKVPKPRRFIAGIHRHFDQPGGARSGRTGA